MTAMELAALASAAVPGLSPTGVTSLADDPRDFISALVQDAKGNQWRVRCPKHPEAALRLETELQVLSGFSNAVRASLPFDLPSAAGAVTVGNLRTFVYNHVPGLALELNQLISAGTKTAEDIGRSIAAIHNLSEDVVDLVNLPNYSCEQFRQRRLNELDQAANTGHVPPALLSRWEHAMEDKDMWNFNSVVVHGDLHEDNLLFDKGQVSAVTGWTDLHVGDPADDFAWLATSSSEKFRDDVLTSYEKHRGGESDDHLSLRSALSAEFAMAQWLLKGLALDDQQMVEQGKTLLQQLADDIAKYGGQEVSVTPIAGPEEKEAPAGTDTSEDAAAEEMETDSLEEGAVITDADLADGQTSEQILEDESGSTAEPATDAIDVDAVEQVTKKDSKDS